MKILVYFLVWCITNTIVAQKVIKTEDVLILNDSITLPGTLTFSAELKTQPLLIFIHGSGNVDRNGNQKGLTNANYIKQLSDSLSLRGIAFYRYDKRTSTPENLKRIISNLKFDAFVEDAVLAINKFKDDKRFSSINLVGHSQGSLVAMLASKENISNYISLSGPSESIDQTIIKQVQTQSGDSLANIVQSHFKELSETGSIKNVDPNLLSLFNKPTQPFFKSWMSYNPSEEIKKLEIPVLILNGNKDLQVKIEDANNLHVASPNSKLVIIENMNHVLKTIKKDEDNLKSYYSPDFPLSKQLIATIEAFIKK